MPTITLKSEDELAENLSAGGTGVIIAKGGFFTLTEGVTPADTVLARFTGLTQTEEDSIRKFVEAEVRSRNWGKYDEFFCFALAGSNALIGFIAKTATNNGATFGPDGAIFAGAEWIDSNFSPSVDGVNYKQDDGIVGAYLSNIGTQTGSAPTLVSTDAFAVGLILLREISGQIESYQNAQIRLLTSAPLASNNLYIAGRTSATDVSVVTNGVAESGSVASDGVSANSVLIAKYIVNGYLVGTISSFIIGGAIGFNQAAHAANHLEFLIDLGVFVNPVLNRYSALTQQEIDALTVYINNEVRAGNHGLKDEEFCFALNATDRLIGMFSKTAVNNGATFGPDGATFAGAETISTNFNFIIDAVKASQNNIIYGGMLVESGASPENGGPYGSLGGSAFIAVQPINNRFRGRVFTGVNFNQNWVSSSSNLILAVREDASNQQFVLNGGAPTSQATASIAPAGGIAVLGLQGANNFAGTMSSCIIGGAIGFDHAAHYTNHLEFLIDLGVFVNPVLNRFSNLSSIETQSITDFVNQEVRDGNWSSYSEFYCFSLNATDAPIGFKSKTGNPVNAPSHNIDGYRFNGATQYFDTGYNPGLDGSEQDSISLGLLLTSGNTITSANTSLGGATNGAPTQFILSASTPSYNVNNTTPITTNKATFGKGDYLGIRTAAGAMKHYFNGVESQSSAAASSGLTTGEIFVGARNDAGAANYSNPTIALCVVGGALADPLAHYNNKAKLLTDLGVTL